MLGTQKSRLFPDSRELRDQEFDQRSQQRFAMPPDIVNDLEGAQLERTLFTGDATVRTQPRPEQGPEVFKGVDMHPTKPLGSRRLLNLLTRT
jgi:hypothetical protein